MKEIAFRLTDLPVRHPYLVSKQVDGKNYVFHSKKTVFFTLNSTASEILALCDGKHSVLDIVRLLVEKYEIDRKEVVKDVAEYIVTLAETEMLEFKQPMHGGKKMAIYERPAIMLVGSDGKPSHLGAIIRFKAINVEELTGKSIKEVIKGYERGDSKLSIQFNIVDVVEAGSEKAKKVASRG